MRALRMVAVCLAVVFPAAIAAAQSPLLVNADAAGLGGNEDGVNVVVSATGRYVAFDSFATNLVPGGASGYRAVYFRDMITGHVELVSVDSTGAPASGDCLADSITPDGRFISFRAHAWAVLPGAHDGNFVRDRLTGTTTMVTYTWYGTTVNAFGDSQVSDDGRWIAFENSDNYLVPGDSDNQNDVFVRDLQAGVTELVCVNSLGDPANAPSGLDSRHFITADGRFVVFSSAATNLVPDAIPAGSHTYRRDRQTGVTELLDVTTLGAPGNGTASTVAISSNGRFVVFDSTSTNLLSSGSTTGEQLFLRDLQTGDCELVGVGTLGEINLAYVQEPTVSDDGRWIAFESDTQLVEPNQVTMWMTYLRDRLTGLTHLVGIDPSGQPSSMDVRAGTMSRDGRGVGFHAGASLLPQDVNAGFDAYLYDRLQAGPWKDLGAGLAGSVGVPVLAGEGTLAAGAKNFVALAQALPGAPATLVVGLSTVNLPLKGGVLVPAPGVLIPMSTGSGKLLLTAILSQGIPSGTQLVLQLWIKDAGGASGFAASNALRGTTP